MAQINSSHSYLQQNYNVPTIPPFDSKFKNIKKFVARCIAYFTNAQNAFNANVVRTFDNFQIQIESFEMRTNLFEKNISDINEIIKLLKSEQTKINTKQSQNNAVINNLHDMQEHHGGVIANMQKKIDSTIQLISKNQNCIENVIDKLNSNKKNINGIDKRQNDLSEKLIKTFDDLNKRQNDLSEKLIKTFDDLNKRQNDLSEKLIKTFDDLNKRQNDLSEKSADSFDKLNAKQDDTGRNLTALAERIKLSEQGFTELSNLMKEFSNQTSLLNSSLNNALSDFSENKNKSNLKSSLNVLKDLWNDSDYAAYENAYRGADKIISERLNYYLKWLNNIETSKKNYVLDLGCGRGEFVELLNNNKIHAYGIDLNVISVKHAKEKNINVKCADIFKELKKTKPETLPAISAFHVIEHFDFTELQSFLQLSATRIKKGGMLLLETPNALNLQVAASDFYKDPTHVRPVHPVAIEFWLKRAGFSEIELNFIHPFSENEQLEKIDTSDSINSNFSKLNEMIFGARDCAIIAKK